MIRMACALGGGALVAIGTALAVYGLLGMTSRSLIWDPPERSLAAVGAGLVVVGALLSCIARNEQRKAGGHVLGHVRIADVDRRAITSENHTTRACSSVG
jgi:hypothetical protein